MLLRSGWQRFSTLTSGRLPSERHGLGELLFSHTLALKFGRNTWLAVASHELRHVHADLPKNLRPPHASVKTYAELGFVMAGKKQQRLQDHTVRTHDIQLLLRGHGAALVLEEGQCPLDGQRAPLLLPPSYVAKRVFLEAFMHPMEPARRCFRQCNELFERGANLDLLQFVLEVSCMQMKSRLTPNDIKPELCTLLMKDAAVELGDRSRQGTRWCGCHLAERPLM